jgi:putative endonuclease
MVKTRNSSWQVYMLLTAAGLLYTGISTDPARRLKEHEAGKRGARSLRGKGPLQIVFLASAADRSAASILEARIKRLSKTEKLQLIRGAFHELGIRNLLVPGAV